MRISHSLSIIGLAFFAIASTSVYALPSAPPPGGYTGGVFSYYFRNIVE
jgi:hypothetical protein